VTADKARQPGTRRGKGRQAGPETPDQGATPRPGRERRLVDVDPWAMLLEGLLEASDEAGQGERKPSKAK
jgi:hypothetical protein